MVVGVFFGVFGEESFDGVEVYFFVFGWCFGLLFFVCCVEFGESG